MLNAKRKQTLISTRNSKRQKTSVLTHRQQQPQPPPKATALITNYSHSAQIVSRLCSLLDIFFRFVLPWTSGGIIGFVDKKIEYLKTMPRSTEYEHLNVDDSLAIVECFPFLRRRYVSKVIRHIGIEKAWFACTKTNFPGCVDCFSTRISRLCDDYHCSLVGPEGNKFESKIIYKNMWKTTTDVYIINKRAIASLGCFGTAFPIYKSMARLLSIPFILACKRGHLDFVKQVFPKHYLYMHKQDASKAIIQALRNGREEIWNYLIDSSAIEVEVKFADLVRCFSKNIDFGLRLLKSKRPNASRSYIRNVVVGTIPCCDGIPCLSIDSHLARTLLEGSVTELRRVMQKFKIAKFSCVDEKKVCIPLGKRFIRERFSINTEAMKIYRFLAFCPLSLRFEALSSHIIELSFSDASKFLSAIGMDRCTMIATECSIVTDAVRKNNFELLRWMFHEYSLTCDDILVYPIVKGPFGVACICGALECATFLYEKIKRLLPTNPRGKTYESLKSMCTDDKILEFLALCVGIPMTRRGFEISEDEESYGEESDTGFSESDHDISLDENDCDDQSTTNDSVATVDENIPGEFLLVDNSENNDIDV
jgi:hypothetical protein